MRRNWKVVERVAVSRWAAPYVSINPEGHILISRRTIETLGNPESVVLLYDEETETIGLKPARKGEPHAFPLRKQGKHGGRVVRGYQLLKEFNIKVPESVKFPATDLESGVLLLDLKNTVKVRNLEQRTQVWISSTQAENGELR